MNHKSLIIRNKKDVALTIGVKTPIFDLGEMSNANGVATDADENEGEEKADPACVGCTTTASGNEPPNDDEEEESKKKQQNPNKEQAEYAKRFQGKNRAEVKSELDNELLKKCRISNL